MPSNSSGSTLFYVVISCSVEHGYPKDPMSLPREAFSFTAHQDASSATARLISELDYDISLDGVLALRRSWLLLAEIPNDTYVSSPGHWLSDRTKMLCERARGMPGAHSKASVRGTLPHLLVADVLVSARDLVSALATREPDGLLAAAAMGLAASCARAAHWGGIESSLAEKTTETAHEIAAKAWEGISGSDYTERLTAIISALSVLHHDRPVTIS